MEGQKLIIILENFELYDASWLPQAVIGITDVSFTSRPQIFSQQHVAPNDKPIIQSANFCYIIHRNLHDVPQSILDCLFYRFYKKNMAHINLLLNYPMAFFVMLDLTMLNELMHIYS